MTNVDLSICCVTYNHEAYIEECIEGFLGQKTEYKIEILVHDDASTDGTQEKLKRYEAQYPELIKVVYQRENHWVGKGINPLLEILLPSAKGKYIALCEGDDYWCNPDKVQKQLSFLENNQDYSVCFHSSIIINRESKVVGELGVSSGEFTTEDLFKDWFVPTSSVVFRNIFNSDPLPSEADQFRNGDLVLYLWLSRVGKLKSLGSRWSTYRRHQGGVSNYFNPLTAIKETTFLFEYFNRFYLDSKYETAIQDGLKLRIDKYVSKKFHEKDEQTLLDKSNEVFRKQSIVTLVKFLIKKATGRLKV